MPVYTSTARDDLETKRNKIVEEAEKSIPEKTAPETPPEEKTTSYPNLEASDVIARQLYGPTKYGEWVGWLGGFGVDVYYVSEIVQKTENCACISSSRRLVSLLVGQLCQTTFRSPFPSKLTHVSLPSSSLYTETFSDIRYDWQSKVGLSFLSL